MADAPHTKVERLDRTRPPPGGNYSEGAPAERVAKLARAWAINQIEDAGDADDERRRREGEDL